MGTHPIFESDFDCLTDVERVMVNGDGSGHNQGTETEFRDSQNHSMAIVSEPDNLSGRPRSPMITSGHNWSRPWICGLGSGVCDILLTFPINKLMFRQQLNGYTATNAARSLIEEMRGKKMVSKTFYLYRGCLPPTVNRCIGRMFTFGAYDNWLQFFSQNKKIPTIYCQMSAAICSGLLEALFCCPLERCQTILQDSSSNRKFRNTLDVRRELGYREWYRGIRPIALRNGPATFIYYQTYEKTKDLSDSDFIRGAMGGIAATCYAYIFNVIKARQQAILCPNESRRFRSMRYTLLWIYRERNEESMLLFRGFPFALVRTSLSWGITTWFYRWCYAYLDGKDR